MSEEKFSCEGCSNCYSKEANLCRHQKKYPEHKSVKTTNLRNCKETCKTFFANCSQYHRRARIKELLRQLSDEELQTIVLPVVAKAIPTFKFVISRCSSRYNVDKDGVFTKIIQKELQDLYNQALEQYPAVSLACKPAIISQTHSFVSGTTKGYARFIDDWKCSSSDDAKLIELIKTKPALAAECIVKSDIGKQVMMQKIQAEYKEAFIEMNVGLLSSLPISQKQYQDVVRNHWGKKLFNQIGLNPFLPKATVIHQLNETKEMLKKEIGLNFICNNEIVAAYTDVAKHLQFLLKQPGIQDALQFPNYKMIIYDYMDEYCFMGWSAFYTGETSIQIKIVEPHNLLSLVIKAGRFTLT